MKRYVSDYAGEVASYFDRKVIADDLRGIMAKNSDAYYAKIEVEKIEMQCKRGWIDDLEAVATIGKIFMEWR